MSIHHCENPLEPILEKSERLNISDELAPDYQKTVKALVAGFRKHPIVRESLSKKASDALFDLTQLENLDLEEIKDHKAVIFQAFSQLWNVAEHTPQIKEVLIESLGGKCDFEN